MKKKSKLPKTLSTKDLKAKVLDSYIKTQINPINPAEHNPAATPPLVVAPTEIEKLKESAVKYVTDNLGGMDKLVIKDNLITNMFAKMFEPKIPSRFVVEIMDENGKLIIPHYLIKEVKNISFYYNWLGKVKMSPLEFTIYDPINPASLPTMLNTKNNYEILIRLVGPVGDVLETTYITGAKIKSIRRTNLKWAPYNKDIEDQVCLNVTFKVGKFSLGELV
jgi:hypothetical protein